MLFRGVFSYKFGQSFNAFGFNFSSFLPIMYGDFCLACNKYGVHFSMILVREIRSFYGSFVLVFGIYVVLVNLFIFSSRQKSVCSLRSFFFFLITSLWLFTAVSLILFSSKNRIQFSFIVITATGFQFHQPLYTSWKLVAEVKHYLTNILTPRSRTILEKLMFTKLVKKFPDFYGTRRFITVFTKTRHWYLSWTRWLQSTNTPTTSLKSFQCYPPISSLQRFDQIFVWISYPSSSCYIPSSSHHLIWSNNIS
jgi:hypothetical protein